jgi:hypothetical protein
MRPRSAGATTVFTFTGLTDGSYEYQQSAPLDLEVLPTNLQSSAGAGGPQPAYYLYADGAFGSVENYGDWLVKITANGFVNPSTIGMGVDNNLFSEGSGLHETLHFEMDDEHASTVGGSKANLVYVVKIGVSGLDAGETLNYVAYYIDGTNSGSTTVQPTDLLSGSVLVRAPGGDYIDRIDLAAGPTVTTVRLTSFAAYVADSDQSELLDFDVTATDGDGDAVAGSLQITVSDQP